MNEPHTRLFRQIFIAVSAVLALIFGSAAMLVVVIALTAVEIYLARQETLAPTGKEKPHDLA